MRSYLTPVARRGNEKSRRAALAGLLGGGSDGIEQTVASQRIAELEGQVAELQKRVAKAEEEAKVASRGGSGTARNIAQSRLEKAKQRSESRSMARGLTGSSANLVVSPPVSPAAVETGGHTDSPVAPSPPPEAPSPPPEPESTPPIKDVETDPLLDTF